MSLDRFVNKTQVSSYTPTFGKTITDDDIITIDRALTKNDVSGEFDKSIGLEFTPNKEIHIYADTNLIKSSYGNFIDSVDKQGLPIVYNIPELDLRSNGIQQGSYSMVYNYHHNIISSLRILEISADRTEVKLGYAGNGITNGVLPTLRTAFSDFGINSLILQVYSKNSY